jgi:low affinity Fe/Cu permease
MTLSDIEAKLDSKLKSVDDPIKEVVTVFEGASKWLETQINQLLKDAHEHKTRHSRES